MSSAAFVPMAVAPPKVFRVCRQITKPVSLVAASIQPTSTSAVLLPSEAVTDAGTFGEPLRVVTLLVADGPLTQPPSPSVRRR